MVDDLECDLTRVDTDDEQDKIRQRIPSRPLLCGMSEGSGSDTESLRDVAPNLPADTSCRCRQERWRQSKVPHRGRGRCEASSGSGES